MIEYDTLFTYDTLGGYLPYALFVCIILPIVAAALYPDYTTGQLYAKDTPPDIYSGGGYSIEPHDAIFAKMTDNPNGIDVSDFDNCRLVYDVISFDKSCVAKRSLITFAVEDAVNTGDLRVLKVMMQNDHIRSSTDFADDDGWTAVMLLASQDRHEIPRILDCLKLLLDNGADTTLQNKCGRTALDIATTHDHEDEFTALIK